MAGGFLRLSGPPIPRDAMSHGGRTDAMSDDTKPGATPGDDTANDQTDDQATTDDDDQTSDLGEKGKLTLRKEREAREQAEKARTTTERELKATQRRLKEFEDAGKSELEKATGERDTWQKTATDYQDKYRKVAAAETVRTEAVKLGADPRRVDRIVRLVKPDLAYGEDDAPTNVTALLADLKKTDADLFQPVSPGKGDGGAGNNGKPKEDHNAPLLRAFGRTR